MANGRKKDYTLWAIVFLVLGLFVYSIGFAIWLTLKTAPSPGSMPPILVYIATSVDAILIGNLGVLLGVKALEARGRLTSSEETDPIQGAQMVAGWIYVLILVVVFFVWSSTGFSEDPDEIVSLLVQIPTGGIGLMIAAFAGYIGIKRW